MPRRPRHADFFRTWTPDLAYVLGLWWTDGCMRIKNNTDAHEFEIAANDKDHLTNVAKLIGGNYHLRKVATNSNTYKVTFCSQEMYRDIENLGGSPRKSRTIGFPDIPAELLPHFVRGVVDGDGTLAWNGDRPVVQVYSGSTRFLDSLVVAVERATGIPAPNRVANRDNWTVKWSTIRAKCLVAWMYDQNIGVALPRKMDLARRFLQWQPRKAPHYGTVTEQMRERFAPYLRSNQDALDEARLENQAKADCFGDKDESLVQSQFSFE